MTMNQRHLLPQVPHLEESPKPSCALGSNFTPLHFTNTVCSVSPYSKSYSPIDNVPIVTGATAVQLPTGATIILIVHQAL